MAFISNDEINNIRAKANIVDIVGSYVSLTQRGRNYVCVCPFHDDHSPSMSVSAEKQIYKCFSCGATGNVFTFVSEYENISFLEAVSQVADRCGIVLSQAIQIDNTPTKFIEEFEIMNLSQKFFVNNLKTEVGQLAREYLHKRGINDDTIKEFGIGLSLDSPFTLTQLLSKKEYSMKKLIDIGIVNEVNGKQYDMFSRRITFPLWDKDGNIVGFSARVYRDEKDVSKYMNSKENLLFTKGETLYNYHRAKEYAKREKEVLVVEGFMDAIRISLCGVKNVVALCGTAMTKEQISLLKKLRCKVILCLDNDDAGLVATVNNGEELINSSIETEVIRLTGSKDPDEYILKNGAEAFITNVKSPVTYFEFKMNYLKRNRDLTKIEDLSLYINDVLHSLSGNKDMIFREISLKKLSEDYGVSYETLKEKLKSMTPVTENVLPVPEILAPPKKIGKKSILEKSIESILYFMMNGSSYVQIYQNKLGFIGNPLYREIANEILYYVDKNHSIQVADFITYISQNTRVKDKVMEIVNSSSEGEVSEEIMNDYVNAILKIMTKQQIKTLKEQMKKEMDLNKKLKLAEQLAALKKDVF